MKDDFDKERVELKKKAAADAGVGGSAPADTAAFEKLKAENIELKKSNFTLQKADIKNKLDYEVKVKMLGDQKA